MKTSTGTFKLPSPQPTRREQKLRERLTIGFAAIADFRSVIGQEIVAGIQKAAEDYDLNLIFFTGIHKYSLADDINCFNHYKKKFKYMNLRNIDGLISWASSFQSFISEDEIRAIHKEMEPLPIVSIGMSMDNASSVFADSFNGIRLAVEHFVRCHKYTKIGFIGCKGKAPYEKRFKAYREILSELGIAYNPEIVVFADTMEVKHINKAVSELFVKRRLVPGKDVQALITVSDIIARHAISELEAISIFVPRDIAIIGFNNQLDSISSPTPITTINPHFFQEGYLSVEMLLSRIKTKSETASIYTPCNLIIRQSCGCFEDSIVKAQVESGPSSKSRKKNRTADPISRAEYPVLISSLTSVAVSHGVRCNPVEGQRLLDAVLFDLKHTSSHRSLQELKSLFFDRTGKDNEADWQGIISGIRSLLLPYLIGDQDLCLQAENIFHQARVMIDVANKYVLSTKTADVYKANVVARISSFFASAVDLGEIITIIRRHLGEMDIPGIYFALFDEVKADIGNCHLVFACHNGREFKVSPSDGLLPSGGLIPKKYFPKGRRQTFVFELCYYENTSLGFLLFEAGTLTMPFYDTLRAIISPSLYAAVLIKAQHESVREKQSLLQNPKISLILNRTAGQSMNLHSHILSPEKILDYLCSHINDPTDLTQIAGDLNTSKPSLVRKAKALTGYSIQQLHEMLKIEQAQLLLAQSKPSIAHVASRLGYKTQSYFAKVFKKHTGHGPLEWLKLNSQ